MAMPTVGDRWREFFDVELKNQKLDREQLVTAKYMFYSGALGLLASLRESGDAKEFFSFLDETEAEMTAFHEQMMKDLKNRN